MQHVFKQEEVDFYVRETQISSIHKALLTIAVPGIKFSKMSKQDIIIKLMLLKKLLLAHGFVILPLFLLCNIENRELIHKHEKRLTLFEILQTELASPIRVISFEFNQTNENGDLFNNRHMIDLLSELKVFLEMFTSLYDE